MKKKLLKNLGLKLLSIVIAVVLWFVVVMTNNPKDTKTFSNIEVKLVNVELLEKEGKMYEILENTNRVRVTVEMPRNQMGELSEEDIVAEADMSKLTEINTVPINYYVLNNDLNVSGVTGNRDVVRLKVEDKAEKWVNVYTEPIGEVAEGFMLDTVYRNPNRLLVSGPKSVVEKIDKAVVELDVSNATSNVIVNLEPTFYDVEGNVVEVSPSLTKNEDTVNVEAQVLAYKDVPIGWSYMGIPAEGYLVTGATSCDPSTVRVAGTLQALRNVNRITIPREDLDISGATEDYTENVNLRKYLPDNVKLADESSNGRAAITIGIAPRVERTLTIPSRNISIQGLPEGMTAAFENETGSYRQVISGLEAAVSAVDQAEVKGAVDLAAWMKDNDLTELSEGVYNLPVSLELPDNVRVEGELIVAVNISEVEED